MREYSSEIIEQYAYQQAHLLPYSLTIEDIDFFLTILYRIDKICGDNPSAYRLLMPFHKLSFGWQIAYTDDFTWEKFLNDAIENNLTSIKIERGPFGPIIKFSDEIAAQMVSDD